MKKRSIQSKSNRMQYAGLQIRLMANLIDCMLIAILFLPLFAIISNLIYGNVVPGEVFIDVAKEMEQVSKGDPSFNASIFLENNKRLQDFLFKDNGIIKIILNFSMQFLMVGTTLTVFWIRKQFTPGKSFLSLKIVDASTLSKPTNKQFILRMLGLFISVAFFFLGIIWIAFDPKKQGWHDKIANTIVIKDKK